MTYAPASANGAADVARTVVAGEYNSYGVAVGAGGDDVPSRVRVNVVEELKGLVGEGDVMVQGAVAVTAASGPGEGGGSRSPMGAPRRHRRVSQDLGG